MGLKPVKVSQLNNYIKRILQSDPILGSVSVIGEISNLKFHNSGHVYFSLKDEKSRINCFLAADNVDAVEDMLVEGNEVTARGYIYLYERGGSYSLNVRTMESAGKARKRRDLRSRAQKSTTVLSAESRSRHISDRSCCPGYRQDHHRQERLRGYRDISCAGAGTVCGGRNSTCDKR